MPFPLLDGTTFVGSVALYGHAGLLEQLPPTVHDFYAALFGVTGDMCEAIDVCVLLAERTWTLCRYIDGATESDKLIALEYRKPKT